MARLTLHQLRNAVLGPVDLEVPAGGCAMISGSSGSGKTLLLRAIADLDPHDGEVSLNGLACRDTSPTEWRRQVAYLPGESQWWFERVGDHFDYWNKELIDALGFPTEAADWDVHRLSSGEKQRLGLARMLCNQPQVLLLDEPTANLDPVATDKVEVVLRDYREQTGATVLWVSHDPAQIERMADCRYVVVDGRLMAAGEDPA